MAKMSKERIASVVRAVDHESVKVPFYYAPPYLDVLRKHLQERLASRGGRPSIPDLTVIRKTRYSKETWAFLTELAAKWSKSGGVSVSPSQAASIIVEQFLGAVRVSGRRS